MKTLLVEDNAADARLIQEMLKEWPADNFQLEQVGRLDAALQKLRQEVFDLVLLDLGLLDSQGIKTLTLVHKADPSLPIVILTGLDDDRLALETMRSGAQDYLVKGRFDSQLLVRTIRYAVERKRAEDEVRRLNTELERRVAERTAALDIVARKFATMFDTTSDGVWLHDLEGRVLEVNDAYCRMSGYSREELVQMPISRLEAEESPEEIARHIRKVLEKGGHDHFESRHRRKDGSLFDVDITALYLNIGEGRIAIFVRDITERKRAEEALRENERRYRELFQNMSEGMAHCRMLFDEHGRAVDFIYLNVNNAFERLTGLHDVTGRRVTEVVPGIREAHPELFEIYSRVALTGEPARFEIDFRPLGIWLSVSAYSYQTEHFIALFDNITERKRGEQALRQAEATAREATLWLQAMMEAVPVGISFSDDTTCERITGNHAVLAQFEVERQDNLSASARDADAPGRQVRFFQDGREIGDGEFPLQRAVAENQVIPPEELEVLLPSGRRWFCEASGAPVRDAEGKVLAGLAVTQDITARKQAEEALVRAEKLAAVGRMSAAVAHEINNPLAAVMNSIYLALSDASLGETTRQYLGTAEQELVRVAHITRETLAFYRNRGVSETMLAGDLIKDVLRTFEHRLRNKKLAVTKDVVGQAGNAMVAGEVRQVLSNIVANSIDALPNGGRLHIHAHCGVGRRGLMITVADNGTGIPQELQQRIFEPFFTTKEDFGTGLGLWVARELLRRNGGSIRVRSRPGRGTVFTVFLPMSMAEGAVAD